MSQLDAAARTALVVVAHHRTDSLTAHTARRTVAQLETAGYVVDLLDLHAEGFDPRMNVADQPDWGDREKPYSDEVRAHMRRVSTPMSSSPCSPCTGRACPPSSRAGSIACGTTDSPTVAASPAWRASASCGWAWPVPPPDDPVTEGMQALLETNLSEGIAYYCGFAHSPRPAPRRGGAPAAPRRRRQSARRRRGRGSRTRGAVHRFRPPRGEAVEGFLAAEPIAA